MKFFISEKTIYVSGSVNFIHIVAKVPKICSRGFFGHSKRSIEIIHGPVRRSVRRQASGLTSVQNLAWAIPLSLCFQIISLKSKISFFSHHRISEALKLFSAVHVLDILGILQIFFHPVRVGSGNILVPSKRP